MNFFASKSEKSLDFLNGYYIVSMFNLIKETQMSYRIEQKNGNKIYVYEATNHWDPQKKRAQQTRVYLGVKDPRTGEILTPRKDKWKKTQNFTCGVTYAIEKSTESNHLREILEQEFGPEDGGQIFSLASYCATEGSPMYLYENWAYQTAGQNSFARSSQSLSVFLHRLGGDEKSRLRFWAKWAQRHGKNRNLVFDLSSISTYSQGMEYAEWGYNRDGEDLPQINVGMIYSDRPGMPLGYKVYPGSVGDVSTMKNLIHHLVHDLKLAYARLILDRGFFSNANIRALDAAGFDYIIPVPASLQPAKEIWRETENAFMDESQYFEFNGRLMACAQVCREYAGEYRSFMVYLDFDRRRAETQNMLNKLAMVESRFADQNFTSQDEAENFVESVARGMSKMFSYRKTAKRYVIRRNPENIHRHAGKFGKLILMPKNFGTDRLSVLADYFRRDGVEKFFDTLKNEMDSKRGRVQSQQTFDGRLFVHMIGLIIYGEIQNRIRKNKSALKCNFSFPEIISHLKRLKQIHSSDGTKVLTELTAKQKMIFKLLDISAPA